MAVNIADISTEELIRLQEQKQKPAESQRVRSALQGATYNIAEEIEAGIRSVLPESMGGGEYSQIRNELRSKLKSYKEQNPGEAITYELMGALVPALGTMLIPGMQAAGPARLASIAGIEGLTSYVGAMEGKPTQEDIAPAAITGAVSAAAGPLGQSAVGGAGAVGSRLVNLAREMFGSKPADAVQAELRRLAEGTGKSIDEIVQDVIDGKIMAENRTLQAAVRALKNKGGQAGALITETLPARRSSTKSAAMEQAQSDLAPSQGNVLKTMSANDKQLGELESESYKRVFGDNAEVTPDIAKTMMDLIQRFPDVRGSLSSLYGERSLVPLFAADDAGAISLKRIPTLEDAEILRRAIDEQASTMYRAGSGTRGEAAAEAASTLRTQLDDQFPDLASVRTQARQRRVIRDQFAEGRKALGGKSSDEIEIMFEEAQKQGGAAVRAFRAGVMDAIRKRSERSPSLMGRLADPDRQEGAVLRIVYPESSVDDIQRKLDIAAGSQELYDKVIHNSMTAPEQAAASQMGLATTMADVSRLTQGDPMAAINLVAKKLAAAMPQLSDKDRLGISQVLLTEDPNMVLRALTDNTSVDELIRRAMKVANVAGAGVRTATAQQAGLLFQGDQ